MRCMMPATRISTNSSRLLAVMARNLTRSSKGLFRILGFLEHAAIEIQPRFIAADKKTLGIGVQTAVRVVHKWGSSSNQTDIVYLTKGAGDEAVIKATIMTRM